MATYEEQIDNTETRAAIAQGTQFMREKAGEFARLANSIAPLLIGAGSDYIDAAIGSLEAGTLIPIYDPQSEFKGATYMAKERYQQLKSLAQSIVKLNDDSIKAACVEACGPFKVC